MGHSQTRLDPINSLSLSLCLFLFSLVSGATRTGPLRDRTQFRTCTFRATDFREIDKEGDPFLFFPCVHRIPRQLAIRRGIKTSGGKWIDRVSSREILFWKRVDRAYRRDDTRSGKIGNQIDPRSLLPFSPFPSDFFDRSMCPVI